MSKNFSQKDRNRGVTATDVLPQDLQALLDQITAKPATELSLPDRFLNWLGRPKARFHRRAQGVEPLEPRVLLSGDPLTAAFSVTTSAALRVAEVQYDADPGDGVDTKSEYRLQLVQGADASGTNVVSERRIRVIDGTKRVVDVDANGNVTQSYDSLSINVTGGGNSLLLDQ